MLPFRQTTLSTTRKGCIRPNRKIPPECEAVRLVGIKPPKLASHCPGNHEVQWKEAVHPHTSEDNMIYATYIYIYIFWLECSVEMSRA